MTRKYAKPERDAYLERWKASGLSGSQFCKDNGIKPTTFYSWLKSAIKKENHEDTDFIRIPETVGRQYLHLEYGPWRINLPPGFKN